MSLNTVPYHNLPGRAFRTIPYFSNTIRIVLLSQTVSYHTLQWSGMSDYEGIQFILPKTRHQGVTAIPPSLSNKAFCHRFCHQLC